MTEKKKYTGRDLTIVICAYKECDYLEECIRSIKSQTVKARVMISTSTPNDFIQNLADKYKLKVRVNENGGHVKDYNFAFSQIQTRLGMLAHQDDVLAPQFVEKNLRRLNRAKDPILAFSNYLEMHGNKADAKPSGMIRIKRLLTWPTCLIGLQRTVLVKRLLQCLGNPIAHPTVVCVMEQMPKVLFDERYRASMDWDLWERLSRQKGEFVYVRDVLLYHRMNQENVTAVLLQSTNKRYEEDLEILERFWPHWIARGIMYFYRGAEKYY